MKATHRSCHFCHSEEGKARPVGNYIVKLKQIEVFGTKKLACQSCVRKTQRIIEHKTENDHTMNTSSFSQKLQQFALRIAGLFIMLIITSLTIYAQGAPGLPGFPSSPDPAPIDGGLTLLAAAGGAYAIKKLRDKNMN